MEHSLFRSSPQAEIEYVTAWAGSGENFNLTQLFTDCKAGGIAAGRIPVLYSYIIAFTARRDLGLLDCNIGTPNLCQQGATYIRAHKDDRILPQYRKYAQGVATAWGTTNPVIWLMEPDYYQYSTGGDSQSLTAAEAGALMHEIVTAVKAILPNAVFSLDISPWISNPTQWYGAFTMSDFTFMNTSGGATDADNTRIRASNTMTWRSIYQLTGKPILADDGYGAAGTPTFHDATWDSATNLNARIADGVVGIAQMNAPSSWSSTLAGVRPQLSAPLVCP